MRHQVINGAQTEDMVENHFVFSEREVDDTVRANDVGEPPNNVDFWVYIIIVGERTICENGDTCSQSIFKPVYSFSEQHYYMFLQEYIYTDLYTNIRIELN